MIPKNHLTLLFSYAVVQYVYDRISISLLLNFEASAKVKLLFQFDKKNLKNFFFLFFSNRSFTKASAKVKTLFELAKLF